MSVGHLYTLINETVLYLVELRQKYSKNKLPRSKPEWQRFATVSSSHTLSYYYTLLPNTAFIYHHLQGNPDQQRFTTEVAYWLAMTQVAQRK